MLLFWKMGIGIKHFNFFSSIWSVCKNNSNRMGMIIEQRQSLGFGLNRLWDSHCMRLRLSQISMCDSRWPQIHSSPPASVSHALQLQAWTTMSTSCLWFWDSVALYVEHPQIQDKPYHCMDLNGLNHSPFVRPRASCPTSLSLSSLMLSVAVPALWFGEKYC